MFKGLICNKNVYMYIYNVQTSKMQISRARGKGGGVKLLTVIWKEHDGGREGYLGVHISSHLSVH